ncbi:MAG TPA: prepilin-type N-terminal cleavage/methylation domain-containing protein [Candidatus Saccharimonadales bacterium]|nr:prepilin-type N-terminal cleavage/methylation domain-containing protein [Candidatus Saccharimonadales bacterium]
MKRLTIHRSASARGFTIMETMIATVVFGVVLLFVTTAIIQFSRVYYRGVTESNLQTTTRNIVDMIAQGIQFNGGNITTTPAPPTAGANYAFCVGNQQYSYSPGYMLSDSPIGGEPQKYHVLVVDNVAGCTSSTASQNLNNATVSGRELLGPKMRLARMEVTNTGTNLYKISVRVVYGDDDLLDSPTAATAKCKTGTTGTEFCAVTDITTTVVKRVQ